ncbi:hypothetical protein [Kitasatospora sp. NPDC051914]|uniref:hypothetical protein n=1 Tax=Kitasatospora sp. NPDC051914 TaxID=3154945 RepID=UPI00341B3DA5
MGIYLVDIGTADWFGSHEGGWAGTATALDAELLRRGLPPYRPAPSAPGVGPRTGTDFEEKMSPPVEGFVRLCEAHLSPAETAALHDWTVLVPVPLEAPVTLPIGCAFDDETVIAGAPASLAAAERLAAAIGLPPETPTASSNLRITSWFLDGPAAALAGTRPGPWSEDLSAAFHTAVHLRAAQYVLRTGRPITYC